MLKKLLVAWMAIWLVLGAVLGVLAFRHIAYPIYFLAPFLFIGAVGVIPGSLGLWWRRLSTWKGRLGVLAGYAAALALLFGGPALWRNHYEQPHDQGPYLVWSGDPQSTMTVRWTTAAPGLGAVAYGKDGGALENIAAESAATRYHKVQITGLAPGTAYAYRVPELGAGTHVFSTAPAVAEDFSFAVYGDNRPFMGVTWHPAVMRALMDADRRMHFRFVVNSGDIVENPGPGYGWQWHQFLRDIIPMAATRPYLVSVGNHEVRGDNEPFECYFDYGAPGYWYALDYAGVRLIFVSTQHPLTPGSEQYEWLASTLANRPKDTRFTVVTLHKPLTTHDPRRSYNDPNARAILEPLFRDNGVDVVFAGHVHAYEHLKMDGFDQVITGGGGVMLWNKPKPGPDTIKTETDFHFCAVQVAGDTLTVEAIRKDGSTIEKFSLPSRKGAKDKTTETTTAPPN